MPCWQSCINYPCLLSTYY